MPHVRVIAPEPVAARVMAALTGDDAVAHLTALPGAALSPPGDVIEFDVVREGANAVVDRLRELGVDRDGAIVTERIDTVLSASAHRAARRVPGLGVDAVVWHEIESQTAGEAALSAWCTAGCTWYAVRRSPSRWASRSAWSSRWARWGC
nr:hypothetical protein [uncultured Actinoplanes sp.]